MKRHAYLYVAGLGVLLALAGCGGGYLQYGERPAWRHQAEVSCLKSGQVKLGAGVVQVQPIEGPGMCGADFPLKVAALGEGSAAIGYADDLRPPASVPGGGAGRMPRWPLSDQRYLPPARVAPGIEPVQSQPIQGGNMRWVPGPQPVQRPGLGAPGEPISLSPPGVEPGVRPNAAPLPNDDPDDVPDDAVLPGRTAPPRTQPAYHAPVYQPQQRALPPLGPARGPQSTASVTPAAVTPPATLACPLVSALDRWVSEGVQPAAMRWFGSPVVQIRQISAYSCRGMVGAGTSRISEHAFGNALDIAGFTLADGRKVMVRDGWRGSPEEQGFLHDVQLYACETFSTVLAPGYNAAHYDHFHVDLMRRSSGRRPCRPAAIPGEVAAAKARAVYASKQRGPAYTGSVPTQPGKAGGWPRAVPGEDGYVADEDDDAVTGSIATQNAKRIMGVPGEDGDFDDEDVTGSIPTVPATPAPVYKALTPRRAASDDTIRAQERKDKFY